MHTSEKGRIKNDSGNVATSKAGQSSFSGMWGVEGWEAGGGQDLHPDAVSGFPAPSLPLHAVPCQPVGSAGGMLSIGS